MSEIHPIAEYCRTNDLTLTAFAERVGISRVSLHRIIAGEQTPSIKTARKIVSESREAITLEMIYGPVAA